MSRAQEEATQAPESVYVPNRRSCLSRIQRATVWSGPPPQIPHRQSVPFGGLGPPCERADLPSREEHRGGGFSNSARMSTPVQNSPHLRFKIPHLKDQECVSLAPGAAEARAAFWRWGGAELGAKESASADPVPPSCSRPPISPARRRSFSR